MNKQNIQTKIDEKQKELDGLIQSDAQDQQQRQHRLNANQKRVDQLQGGIDTLKEVLELTDG